MNPNNSAQVIVSLLAVAAIAAYVATDALSKPTGGKRTYWIASVIMSVAAGSSVLASGPSTYWMLFSIPVAVLIPMFVRGLWLYPSGKDIRRVAVYCGAEALRRKGEDPSKRDIPGLWEDWMDQEQLNEPEKTRFDWYDIAHFLAAKPFRMDYREALELINATPNQRSGKGVARKTSPTS